MFNRANFKEFINQSVNPFATSRTNKPDLRVDPYGNFDIQFQPIPKSNNSSDYANSDKITNYGPLGNDFFGKDMHQYIKNINDIELNINSKTLDIPGVQYAIHRMMPMNSSPHFTMMWLNTKDPYIEEVFIPWMQDNTINNEFPLVKTNLEIRFPLLANKEIKYTYYGVRPIEVGLHKITNEPVQDFYRKIAFDYDYFYVDVKDATQPESPQETPTAGQAAEEKAEEETP